MSTTPSQTGSNNAAMLEFANLEIEAKEKAKKKVANLLQRPDQLEKVEHIKKRVGVKKSSVEASLKTSIQSQLDGVRTGINQLQKALLDIKQIQRNLHEVDEAYKSIEGLGERLKDIKEENLKHSQLEAAVDNLKHIFNVPETAKKCKEFIEDGKLLQAHKCLMDLEGSRDDLLFGLSKQNTPSATDKHVVMSYFGDIEKLSDSLAKQMWMILQRCIVSVRKEPTIIVTVLRIIEREERIDADWESNEKATGFMPPARPKHWKKKAFQIMKDTVEARIEGSQMEDRDLNKMWLVRHLEILRQFTIEDLRVVKTLCENCFPPHYNIVNQYVKMYHNAISQHVNSIVQNGLEGNEYVSLLTWMYEYKSVEFMGNPLLKIDTSDLSPLIDDRVVNEMENKYLQNMKSNFSDWMRNSLKTDVNDWSRPQEPDMDADSYFLTALPVILFQMIEQNLQVAKTISKKLVERCVLVVVEELDAFASTYKNTLLIYREKHIQDRSEPQFYLHYMIANINNAKSCIDMITSFRGSYCNEDISDADIAKFNHLSGSFWSLANDMLDYILEDVFKDLDASLQEILTRKWITSSEAVDTIHMTIEDYRQDFLHLKPQFYLTMMKKAQNKIISEYLKALFARKISFKNYDERAPAAEKMRDEAQKLKQLFKDCDKDSTESVWEAVSYLAEMIKLRDTSMISFEISQIASKFNDIKIDQLINVLQMREDIGRGEARQKVIETLGEDHDLKAKPKRTIFSQLYSI